MHHTSKSHCPERGWVRNGHLSSVSSAQNSGQKSPHSWDVRTSCGPGGLLLAQLSSKQWHAKSLSFRMSWLRPGLPKAHIYFHTYLQCLPTEFLGTFVISLLFILRKPLSSPIPVPCKPALYCESGVTKSMERKQDTEQVVEASSPTNKKVAKRKAVSVKGLTLWRESTQSQLGSCASNRSFHESPLVVPFLANDSNHFSTLILTFFKY